MKTELGLNVASTSEIYKFSILVLLVGQTCGVVTLLPILMKTFPQVEK
jgi:hypothetical protein